MPLAVSMHVQGIDELHEKLARISPRKNGGAWVRRALEICADSVQAIAAKEMIIQGSRFRGSAGPRGGKGKLMDASVHPTMLTSRHGGAGIVGSIRVNKSPLPRAIEIGSDKAYAPLHELGLGRYPKRAFLAPALEKASKEFSRIFAKELGRELAK